MTKENTNKERNYQSRNKKVTPEWTRYTINQRKTKRQIPQNTGSINATHAFQLTKKRVFPGMEEQHEKETLMQSMKAPKPTLRTKYAFAK
jgi:hypothetical protein